MTGRLIAVAIAAFVTLGACAAHVDTGVQANVPDPPPPQADAPTRERPDFLWIHGHWNWTGRGWDWSTGRWEHVRAGYSWHDGEWVKRGGTWRYVDGGWVAGESVAVPHE